MLCWVPLEPGVPELNMIKSAHHDNDILMHAGQLHKDIIL